MAQTSLVLLCFAALTASAFAAHVNLGTHKNVGTSELSKILTALESTSSSSSDIDSVVTIVTEVLDIIDCVAEQATNVSALLEDDVVANARSVMTSIESLVSSWDECEKDIVCYMEVIVDATKDLSTIEEDIIGLVEDGSTIVKSLTSCVKTALSS